MALPQDAVGGSWYFLTILTFSFGFFIKRYKHRTFIVRVRFEDSILAFMPRLHLPYDEYTMPLRCPNHRFSAASIGRPCDHRTDLRASCPLRFCLTAHNDKFGKL